ncbi:alpha/beta hydrolase [Tenacibaculum sp. C7A-26P2]|uniref:alpha/beta hydrolase n=1 Tax=Tenacibaculum sp. C7A-26P2 TaxID=3447504 RepID=UPI003F86830E
MTKTPIYFVPGLAASSKIFQYISLPKEHFQLFFIEWILPHSIDESIQDYAKRMSKEIKHKNAILVGVSFGGVMAQEISKHVSLGKLIIISSIKNNNELPKKLQLARKTKAYKLFPSNIISNIEKYERYFFSDILKKRMALYKTYLCVRDKIYLQWAIFNLLHWKQNETLPGILHIHGDHDEIFPIKNIQKAKIIKNGTHIMILDKAKSISNILQKECFLLN